ncbi:hypothetical protein VHEMI10151 [[Torrubiella] hemipterigena]|uniref:Carboxypeptidase n=1 Tax=[Torrubiella] hemipterigena TaxID=1531966 RepID=A0A0A1TSU7_9HYPO|nr:hypothetical protein VHEMI10151 [[Torrubiella] hemipterigena]
MPSLTSVLLVGAAAIAHNAAAQFVPEPNGFKHVTGHAGVPIRYKQVPNGICELNPKVKSFSGFADVAKDEHMFFWFFEARDVDPRDAPLTIWINGGPGSSSMIGLFQELGPCGVDYYGKPYNNPYSFSKVSNMIFIDQPTTVGLSYSKPVTGYVDSDGNFHALPDGKCPAGVNGTCGTFSDPKAPIMANSTDTAAPNLWKTLQGFMGAFPQYARNGINFATESYGGHYGPVFSEYFEKQNAANVPGAKKINLESLLVGNGWFDPVVGYEAFYNFTVSPGNTYDLTLNETVSKQMYDDLYGPNGCKARLQKECSKPTGNDRACADADNFCGDKIEGVVDRYLFRDDYDIRELSPDPFPYNFYVNYLNTPKVQEALGAFTNYSDYSYIVGNAFGRTGDDGREVNTVEDLGLLLKQGVTVALYAGDADFVCNWYGVETIADRVGAPGWAKAGYVNVTTSDNEVHGQVKQSGQFSFTRVYESGHEVPFYKPVLALEMFERVISGRDVATGKKHAGKCYRTHGTPQSTYREGNATVQFSIIPNTTTYDTSKNGPGAPWKPSASKRRPVRPIRIAV